MASSDFQERLQNAINQVNSGQRQDAREILRTLVEDYPNEPAGWMWLATVITDRDERIAALRRVVQLDPANDRARSALAQLGEEVAPPPSVATPVKTAAPAQPISRNEIFIVAAVAIIMVFVVIAALIISAGNEEETTDAPPPTETLTVTPFPTRTPTFTPLPTNTLPPRSTLPPSWTPSTTFTPAPTGTPPPTWTPRPTWTTAPTRTPTVSILG